MLVCSVSYTNEAQLSLLYFDVRLRRREDLPSNIEKKCQREETSLKTFHLELFHFNLVLESVIIGNKVVSSLVCSSVSHAPQFLDTGYNKLTAYETLNVASCKLHSLFLSSDLPAYLPPCFRPVLSPCPNRAQWLKQNLLHVELPKTTHMPTPNNAYVPKRRLPSETQIAILSR